MLVLEDEPVSALLLAKVITDRGWDVCGPHHGTKEALKAVARRLPDAALLDVSLGAETSRAVADALSEAGVPFAFVTGYGPETAAMVAAHPECLVIPKPLDPETASMLLDELLSGREAGRARGAA